MHHIHTEYAIEVFFVIKTLCRCLGSTLPGVPLNIVHLAMKRGLKSINMRLCLKIGNSVLSSDPSRPLAPQQISVASDMSACVQLDDVECSVSLKVEQGPRKRCMLQKEVYAVTTAIKHLRYGDQNLSEAD